MGARILLMEDDGVYAKLATILITELGHTVTVTAAVEDGIRIARENPPTLIITDVNLPGLNGFEAVGLLRREPRLASIPVIAMTAKRIWPEEQRSAAAAGFAAYVEKPIGIDAFRALLESHLAPLGG